MLQLQGYYTAIQSCESKCVQRVDFEIGKGGLNHRMAAAFPGWVESCVYICNTLKFPFNKIYIYTILHTCVHAHTLRVLVQTDCLSTYTETVIKAGGLSVYNLTYFVLFGADFCSKIPFPLHSPLTGLKMEPLNVTMPG